MKKKNAQSDSPDVRRILADGMNAVLKKAYSGIDEVLSRHGVSRAPDFSVRDLVGDAAGWNDGLFTESDVDVLLSDGFLRENGDELERLEAERVYAESRFKEARERMERVRRLCAEAVGRVKRGKKKA